MLGLKVWEPLARNGHVDFSEPGAAYRIMQKDTRDKIDCDAVFAVVNGVPSDEGVAVEIGIVIALDKPAFLFRDDFRRTQDTAEYPLNLMLFAGLPREGWEQYYYTSVAEIVNPAKALCIWATSLV